MKNPHFAGSPDMEWPVCVWKLWMDGNTSMLVVNKVKTPQTTVQKKAKVMSHREGLCFEY